MLDRIIYKSQIMSFSLKLYLWLMKHPPKSEIPFGKQGPGRKE